MSFVIGQDELGMMNAHQLQEYIDNNEVYAQSDVFVEILWDFLNQMMEE